MGFYGIVGAAVASTRPPKACWRGGLTTGGPTVGRSTSGGLTIGGLTIGGSCCAKGPRMTSATRIDASVTIIREVGSLIIFLDGRVLYHNLQIDGCRAKPMIRGRPSPLQRETLHVTERHTNGSLRSRGFTCKSKSTNGPATINGPSQPVF